MRTLFLVCAIMAGSVGCQLNHQQERVRLITLDPGHFHSALVQKTMYANVDPVVHVYAPNGDDLAEHLKRVEGYNSRAQDPTHWQQVVYKGPDYLEKMLADRAGNVVVISGNNARKAEYILKSVQAGFHVLADKPMAITAADLQTLKEAFRVAAEKGVLIYDIMTERFEVTNAIQRDLSKDPALFGQLVTGSASAPAIDLESVHYFSKVVSGSPLKRPGWFFDIQQQGSSIADVATHLVDLAHGIRADMKQVLSPQDVNMHSARRWPTPLSRDRFEQVTGLSDFPDYLRKDVVDGALQVYANGEFTHQLKGTWIRIAARWDYKAAAGGDTHHAVVRGTKATLTIRQGPEQEHRPVLYVEKADDSTEAAFDSALKAAIQRLQRTYSGIGSVKDGKAYRITIPEPLVAGHEAHFAQVTQVFLSYLKQRRIPDWERGMMLAKYATTIQADELTRK